MELTQGSETSANYNLTPGKYPKEYIQYSNHGESLKSRIWLSRLSHYFIFLWFHFLSLYIWLHVLYASVQFYKSCIFIVMFMYSYCHVHVFLLLCMFCAVYSVSLCCSVFCLCVNVYCTTTTGCQPNCS